MLFKLYNFELLPVLAAAFVYCPMRLVRFELIGLKQ